jgi:hypothetical protein
LIAVGASNAALAAQQCHLTRYRRRARIQTPGVCMSGHVIPFLAPSV